jgi:aspartokinase-like uncharacterized kinase
MRRVVKVGGSLLERVDLQAAMMSWLGRQETCETLIVTGGGRLVDAIRELDTIRPGDVRQTHWLCVELLDVTVSLMSNWFDWPILTSSKELQHGVAHGFATDRPTLVAVRSFYHPDHEGDSLNLRLPCNWQTTTDTIAALLALRTNADELVLLKSCQIDPKLSLQQLADRGIVDEAFPGIAKKIASVRLDNLAPDSAARKTKHR